MINVNKNRVLGWDIGGAHLKAVLVENQAIQQVWQEPCPLWKGVVHLERAICRVLNEIPEKHEVFSVVTMSGELVDLFDNRDAGVAALINCMQKAVGNHLIFTLGQSQFVRSDEVLPENYVNIASANWAASAALVAENYPGQGIFVDVGSTTTDLIPFAQGAATILGKTDFERLVTDELLYMGVVRTPLMALAQRIPFQSHSVGLMAEFFATTADVFRITGDLSDQQDMSETADGKSKSLVDCCRRLARMIGRDLDSASIDSWRALAREFKELQLGKLRQSILSLLSKQQGNRGNRVVQPPTIVGAGVGQFLVRELCQKSEWNFLSFDDFVDTKEGGCTMLAADCAPAASVALLSRDNSFLHH